MIYLRRWLTIGCVLVLAAACGNKSNDDGSVVIVDDDNGTTRTTDAGHEPSDADEPSTSDDTGPAGVDVPSDTAASPTCDCSPGPNEVATCDDDGACQYECADGFVNLDQRSNTGCECEITQGGNEWCDSIDNNCNGQVDETPIATAISVGRYHSCMLTHSGDAFCWGVGSKGALGNGDTSHYSKPVAVRAPAKFTQIHAGDEHTCALAESGDVWCWGENAGNASLGGYGNENLVPASWTPPSTVKQVSAGGGYSCALLENGDAYCWGFNGFDRTGTGVQDNEVRIPTKLPIDQPLSYISTGRRHGCALTQTGKAHCWGSNAYGKLGDGTDINRAEPVPVQTNLTFEKILASNGFTCALTTGGAAYCWGYGRHGVLGNRTTDEEFFTPQQVETSERFVDLRTSIVGNSACAVTADGRAFCWGHNDDGQLADGTAESRWIPVRVQADNTIVAMDIGISHSCILFDGGYLNCVGSQYYGRLGNGVDESSNAAAVVSCITP